MTFNHEKYIIKHYIVVLLESEETDMKYKAVIFDLDGTLVDSLDDIAYSANNALSMHGFNCHPTQAYRYFVGNGVRHMIKSAAPQDTGDEVIDAVLQDFRKIYNNNYINKTKPYDNIIQLLNKLQEMAVKMAVISNKLHKPTKEIVEKVIGEKYFQLVFGEREGIPRKPDPAALLEAAAIMGVKPSEAIYLGDSGSDMLCARNADMLAAGALWGFREKEELVEAGCQVLFLQPLDLIEFMNKSNMD